MARFNLLDAVKSIISQHHDKAAPPSSSSLSPSSEIINMISSILTKSESIIKSYIQDKSQSEILFLLAILLSVLLFGVILPLMEALFGSSEYDDADKPTQEQAHDEVMSSLSPTRMRMYKPGVGVVEVDVSDITTSTTETSLVRMSSGGSSISSGSSRCSTLGTIEESEEEDLMDSDDENENDVNEDDNTQVTDNKSKLVRFNEEVQVEKIQEGQQEGQGASLMIFAPNETVSDKAKYYEFLHFINSKDGKENHDSPSTIVSSSSSSNDINPFAELLALRHNANDEAPVSPVQEEEKKEEDEDDDDASSMESPIPSSPPPSLKQYKSSMMPDLQDVDQEQEPQRSTIKRRSSSSSVLKKRFSSSFNIKNKKKVSSTRW